MPTEGATVPTAARLGIGITAYDQSDALLLLQQHLFTDALPMVSSIVEDIDISTLDANHILPNIGVPSRRGIWFPALTID